MGAHGRRQRWGNSEGHEEALSCEVLHGTLSVMAVVYRGLSRSLGLTMVRERE